MKVEPAQARALREFGEIRYLLGLRDAPAGGRNQLAWRSEGAIELGWQRLQARKPARSAAEGSEKKRTFSRRGVRAAHEGRQYTPVVRTA